MSYGTGDLHRRTLKKVRALRAVYSYDKIAEGAGCSASWVKKFVEDRIEDPGANRLEYLEIWADDQLCKLIEE